MSNPESFIDEVTEELRRDRLFAAFRKYGWIGALAVVLIVGGAAWREYSKAQAEARAEAFGDALVDALDLGEPAARAAALAEIPATEAQVALRALVQSADVQADRAAALAALAALEGDASQPQLYRDLASLRRVMLAGPDMPLAERRTALEALQARGFGILAREQLAYLLIEEGKTVEAIAALSALVQEEGAPEGLIARASQAIVALGGSLPERSAG
jgi:hypothetical protein